MPKSPYLECGKIINLHGFRGDVKVQPWGDSPKTLAKLPRVFRKERDGMQEMCVEKASVFRDTVILKLAGVDTEAAANALRERVLYAAREDIHLPSGTYFQADIIGLTVYHAVSGETLGEVTDIVNRGASDLYAIRTPDGGEVLLPAVPEFVKKVDLEVGVFVMPIPGMFDDNGETI